MPAEKNRILAELSRAVGSRRTHDWILGGTAIVSLLSVVTSFANTAASIESTTFPQSVLTHQIDALAPAVAESGPEVYSVEDRIRPSDTVSSVIRRSGIEDLRAEAFLRSDPVARAAHARLKTGQLVSMRHNEQKELLELVLPTPGLERAVRVHRLGGEFASEETTLPLDTSISSRSGVIRSSLFAAADEIGLPDAIAIQLAEIFASEIDFHTDLRRGDRFAVVYESLSHEGHEVRAGRVLAAEFTNDGATYRAVLYNDGSGKADYYTPEGRSLRKAFLRSPLAFSRVTSGFSMRTHPILGDWRAHKGVDYSAPTGTSVRATADGHVEFIGQQRGYGNFVVLRHRDRYTTAYGHLNAFAPGLRQGAKVGQGDVIGYVGRTGWATGPHLHYEFRIGGVHQDPLSAALPLAEPLSGAQIQNFQRTVQPLLTRIDLIDGVKSAKAD